MNSKLKTLFNDVTLRRRRANPDTSCSSSESEESWLLKIPDVVIENHLITHLDLPSLKRFRTVCSTTSNWVDKFAHFHAKCIIKVNPFTRIDHLRIPQSCQRFELEFRSIKKSSKFLNKYGGQIHQLNLPLPVPFDEEKLIKMSFFQFCPNLKSLEFSEGWPINHFLPDTNYPPETFQNMKNLKLSLSSGKNMQPDVFVKFGEFLQKFRNLDFLRLHINSVFNISDPNPLLLQRQVVSYLQQRVPALITLQTENEQEAVEDFIRNPRSNFFPLIKTFCSFATRVEYDFRGIENQLEFDSFEDELFSRVTILSAGEYTKRDSQIVNFPFDKFKRIQDLSVHLESVDFFSFYNFPDEIRNFSNVFNNLTKLRLDLRSDSELINLQKAIHVFGFENNKVATLILKLPSTTGERNQQLESVGLEFMKKFQKLRNLSLGNRFFSSWVQFLKKLEWLEFCNVPLGDGDFIGVGLEVANDPVFCQLTRLTHFSILVDPVTKTFPNWTDTLFERVFSKLPLKSFSVCDGNFQLTKKAVEHLAEGRFAETIEAFPYPWKMIHTFRDESRFKDIFLPQDFNDFKRKHFKFFKHDGKVPLLTGMEEMSYPCGIIEYGLI